MPDKDYFKRKKAEQRAREANPEAWDIALTRAIRAMDYAVAMPEHVRPSERVYGDVMWQYENEGIPAVKAMRGKSA